MIYPIVMAGHPILRTKAKEIDKNFPDLEELIANMYETMYHTDGVGLAAPQIGKSIRIFVIDSTALAEDFEDSKAVKKAFINPIIVEESGKEWLFSEGCLSVPGVREDVPRKSIIKIQYYDTDWNKHEEEFDGITARVIQHEYDHLEGGLFTDKLSFLKKKMLKGKLNDIAKGRVNVNYRIRIS